MRLLLQFLITYAQVFVKGCVELCVELAAYVVVKSKELKRAIMG